MRIYSYNIPISKLPFQYRQGLILQTQRGWGEAAPLPGLSQESLFEAWCALKKKGGCPSADFAIRCASIPLPLTFPAIEISALATTFEEAVQSIEMGFQTIKIKVKDYPVLEALSLIAQLQRFPCQLRIDVNRNWSLDEAKLFFERIDPHHIEYIEEPLINVSLLKNLKDLPIALDETLLDPDIEKIIENPIITAIVLKPTILGRRLGRLIELGRLWSKKIVFSSSFESTLGLLHIAHLQAAYNPSSAAGIDTYRFFQHNFFPLPLKNGMLLTNILPPMDQRWLSEFVL